MAKAYVTINIHGVFTDPQSVAVALLSWCPYTHVSVTLFVDGTPETYHLTEKGVIGGLGVPENIARMFYFQMDTKEFYRRLYRISNVKGIKVTTKTLLKRLLGYREGFVCTDVATYIVNEEVNGFTIPQLVEWLQCE